MATKIRVDGREIKFGEPAGLPERPPYRGGRQNVEDLFSRHPRRESRLSENGSNPVEGHGNVFGRQVPLVSLVLQNAGVARPAGRTPRIGAAESGLDLSSSPMRSCGIALEHDQRGRKIIAEQNDKGTVAHPVHAGGSAGKLQHRRILPARGVEGFKTTLTHRAIQILSGEGNRAVWNFPSLIPPDLSGENWMDTALSQFLSGEVISAQSCNRYI